MCKVCGKGKEHHFNTFLHIGFELYYYVRRKEKETFKGKKVDFTIIVAFYT